MNNQIPENKKISPFLVFYLIISIQVGIGVLGFQRVIAKTAGYDSWISVIIAGLSVHLIIWMMYSLNEAANGDLIDIHQFIFGKWIGKALSLMFAVYFISLSGIVLISYMEVIQVWMFPKMRTFWFVLVFLLVAYYFVNGGFRSVTAVSFFGIVLPSYLFLSFLFPITYGNFHNLLPIFDHSIKDILMASYQMSLTYLGYESFLIYYPFIKEPNKSKKWAHLAALTTTLFYTIIALITFIYFSEKQLENIIWATLTMWKIVELPFVERFEYIGIANWFLFILPNVCLPLWCASRIFKRIFNWKQRKSLLGIILLLVVLLPFSKTRPQVDLLNDLLGKTGAIVVYVYIPLLFILAKIRKKVGKNNEKPSS